ncbi:hypothetical protein ACFHYO_05845 [Paracoccus panacisoli]|uniref:Gene transfer agent protein n=2 Tax=Paracoccus TaxID=265 RepID=A0A099G7M4_9RHOB|nr:hypothetical protein [Paracoccus sanguinis]KGJ12799.1 gene transfer agent protein [Paracoccus sanguinis]KGJ18819.1 gene transfer agent protein [Paracoccus sanguinis]KGJ20025.1 gene transfer agent protein [Paracoccus sanguinis]QJD16322.1 hypothetical protein HGN31_04990 [Paracoccus sanguinis]
MLLVEETAPAPEALPVAALRRHLRLGSGFEPIEDETEEAALAGFLRAAIATVEARTGKVLLTRVFRLRLEDWRDPAGQPLPLAPALAVVAVEMTDAAGETVAVPPARFRLIPDSQRPILAPVGAGELPMVPIGGHVTVRFQAGFGTSWDRVPGDLAQAVMMLAARYYEDRGFDGGQNLALPHGVGALIERWRAVRTLAGRGGRA